MGTGQNGSGNALDHAIELGKPEDIARAVDDILARLRHTRDPHEAISGAAALQSARRFEAQLRLADTAARLVGPEAAQQLWQYAVTGLTELDASLTAERLVRSLLVDEPAGDHRGQLLARLGRIKKDQFVDTGDPDALSAAIDAYVEAYRGGTEPLWTGVNTVALRALAERRGLPADDGEPVPVDTLLGLATSAPLPRSAWSITTELELRIARGEPTDALQPLLTQLFTAPDTSGFVYGSFSRQLHEIWEREPSDPLMVMLGEQTLADGRGEVILPNTAGEYERTFGAEFPIPVELYKQGLKRAESVGVLQQSGAFSVGTVFAMKGDDLHPSLAGRTVLLTNEHVIPDPARGENRPQAEELTARFSLIPGADTMGLAIGDLKLVWRRAREDLDVVILVSDDPAIEQLTGLEVASSIPRVRAGAYVYVVGHPGGGGLQLSIRGNDLVDEDGTRLRYKAPTDHGSSGSPVFDEAWKLVGIHHKGGLHLPALNGAPGTQEANEGISVRAIKERLANEPPEV